MNPHRDEERALAEGLKAQFKELLERRASIDRESSQSEKAGNCGVADEKRREIAVINTQELPALRKFIRDAANAARDSRARGDLEKLLRQISQSTPGIYSEREADISPAREAELLLLLATAKTNSARREHARNVERLRRDRSLIEKEREQSAVQDAERRRQHREKQGAKKMDRLLRKFKRNEPQKDA